MAVRTRTEWEVRATSRLTELLQALDVQQKLHGAPPEINADEDLDQGRLKIQVIIMGDSEPLSPAGSISSEFAVINVDKSAGIMLLWQKTTGADYLVSVLLGDIKMIIYCDRNIHRPMIQWFTSVK